MSKIPLLRQPNFLYKKTKDIKMSKIGFSNDLLLKQGKIRVSLTDDYDYEIFVNDGLARTLHVGKIQDPTEEEIYQALRDVGIDPEII